jgi:hypothetical protein
MSVNEIRELENMNPLGPEGNQHFIQLNMTTLEKVADESPSEDAQQPVDAESSDAETLPDMAAAADLQQQALNGAQVSSLLEIITSLSTGLLTPDGAKSLIVGAFPTMPEATVDSIIAGVNEGVPPVTQPAGVNSDGP